MEIFKNTELRMSICTAAAAEDMFFKCMYEISHDLSVIETIRLVSFAGQKHVTFKMVLENKYDFFNKLPDKQINALMDRSKMLSTRKIKEPTEKEKKDYYDEKTGDYKREIKVLFLAYCSIMGAYLVNELNLNMSDLKDILGKDSNQNDEKQTTIKGTGGDSGSAGG